MARKLIAIALVWILLTAAGEAIFIGLFRMEGSGRHHYDMIFADEEYVRRNVGKPCNYPWYTYSCSPEQLAFLQHATTVDFWLDVRDKSLPFVLRSFATLLVVLLGTVAWELWRWHRRSAPPLRR